MHSIQAQTRAEENQKEFVSDSCFSIFPEGLEWLVIQHSAAGEPAGGY